MEVIYTPEIFSDQPFGGISRYIVELAGGVRAAGEKARIIAGIHFNHHLRDQPGVLGMYVRLGAYRLGRQRLALNQTICRASLQGRPDAVVHLTYYADPAYLGSHRPVVVTVHDMIHELMIERYPEMGVDPTVSRHKRLDCERADHIIAVSETTKADLIRLWGVDPARVTAVLHGNSMQPLDESTKATAKEEPFLLHVGLRGFYKNFAALLEAYGRSASLRKGFRLVCFGGPPFFEEELARIAALGLTDRVERRTGDDKALAKCYRDAAAFVYPSQYEGFGLPLIEAMSQGCPVICARTGPMPEVAGEAAVYFDPDDVESIRSTLEASLENPTRLAEIRAAGRTRAREFTWTKCARETLSVYRRLG